MTTSLFVTFIVASALLVFAGLQIMYLIRKVKMHKKEARLHKAGSYPAGSGVSHGMVLNNDKNGVLRDWKKSPSWYSRLI
jgi:hypothetical protein